MENLVGLEGRRGERLVVELREGGGMVGRVEHEERRRAGRRLRSQLCAYYHSAPGPNTGPRDT